MEVPTNRGGFAVLHMGVREDLTEKATVKHSCLGHVRLNHGEFESWAWEEQSQ